MPRKLLRGMLAWILIGLVLGLAEARPARAEAHLSHPSKPSLASFYQGLGEPSVEYAFGSSILFRARLEAGAVVKEARFFFQRPEDTSPIGAPASLGEAGMLWYEYDMMSYPLRAFSRLSYYFEATLEGGTSIRSADAEFTYEDNRFQWESTQSDLIRVHWYKGDAAFGQELLEVAELGLQGAKKWLPIGLRDPIDIYAYASSQEMRSTLLVAGINWVAGHADPDLNLIVVTLAPGPEQRTEMERQIPHELIHHMIAQSIGPAEEKLPTWLNEGLASVNEINPNPYYPTIISQAIEKDSLLALRDICINFPVDASGAYLAYAQADSFTRYLFKQYQAEGLESLVVSYMNSPSLDCLDGITPALGTSLDMLELAWKKSLAGEAPASVEANTPWPWVIVLGLVVGVPGVVWMGWKVWRR